MDFDLSSFFDKKHTIKIKDDIYIINDQHKNYLEYVAKSKKIADDQQNLDLILSLGIKNYDLFKQKNYNTTILNETMYCIFSIWTGREVEDLKKAVDKHLKK